MPSFPELIKTDRQLIEKKVEKIRFSSSKRLKEINDRRKKI
jgi:hypothetical protein